jgi:dTDP-4-dehydrorhamnose 3,5-epimerase
MILGVKTKPLQMHVDERGRLMEILRRDDEIYAGFGQVYITTVYPGVVKAWHYHKVQTDNFACLCGMIKLVLFDARETSPTRGEVNEFFIGDDNRLLVQIPPGVHHGFKGIGTLEAIVLNVPTEPYNHQQPDEYRLPPRDKSIPYDWALKER